MNKIMSNGLVSVLMSVHNNQEDVYKSVESIINQTYTNFEFLIIDDASTDNTLKILNKVTDKRVKIYSNKKNLGLTKSLNYLIMQSKGQFIARQDADDVSLKTRLEKQLNFLGKNNIKVCTTRAFIKNSSKKIPGYSFYIPNNILIKYKNPFIHGTLFIESDLINKIGNYDDRFYYAQDYELFTRLIKNKIVIKTLKEPLYVLNTINNISTNKQQQQQYFSNCVKKGLIPNI